MILWSEYWPVKWCEAEAPELGRSGISTGPAAHWPCELEAQ